MRAHEFILNEKRRKKRKARSVTGPYYGYYYGLGTTTDSGAEGGDGGGIEEGELIPWPKGTVKIDVSDVYDWYKLGQHISNLKGLGKHDFGKGPPQTVMAFGSEPLEHEYIKDLNKIGLKTYDIDENAEQTPKYVYRIDSEHIKDFEKSLKTYYHNKDFTISGRKDFEDSVDEIKGVYAADLLFTALYSTGSSEGDHKTRYVAIYGPGQPIVYFSNKDRDRIKNNISWLTVFDADNFFKLPSGEYFSKNPGAPVKQFKITDPFAYIKKRGWRIKFVEDLKQILKQVVKKSKTNQDLKFGAEGMGYMPMSESLGIIEGKMAELSMDLEDPEISDRQFEKMYGMTRKEARELFSKTNMWDFPDFRDPNRPLHEQDVAESLDSPYSYHWEEGDFGDLNAYAKLSDNTVLDIEFEQTNVDKSQWSIGFQRDGQIHKTGKGDEQRVFATVLSAIKEFIENKQPKEVFFSAEKSEVNPESRKRLYDRLVQKYAAALGYQASQSETWRETKYKLSRIREQGVAEGNLTEFAPSPDFRDDDDRQDMPLLEFAGIIKLFLGSEYTMIDRKTPEQVSVKFDPKDRTSGHNGAVLYSVVRKQNEYPTVNFQLIDYEQGPQVGRGRRAGTAIPKTRTNALKIADMIYNTMGLPQQDRRVEENFPDGKHTAGNYRLQEAGPLKIAGQVAAAHSSANDVVSRFQRGDYAGAGIGALSAIANLKPGLGTAVSLGLDYINDQRDKQNSVANLNKPEVQSGTANDEIKPINPDAAMQENFADGRNPGRKGLAKRMGVPTKASVTRLRQIAKSSSGEKQRMAHWMANMKAGKKK